MRHMTASWAVVLAGGEGSRLRSRTTTREGLVVPKQYCSLRRQTCLFQDALHRAQTVAMPAHTGAVVASQHRRWWTPAVSGLKASNLLVQPQNKGTAHGILLALLQLESINPGSIVTLLPADHYFHDEAAITRMLRVAVNLASANPATTYLLGAEPDAADSELGYILPAQRVRDKAAEIVGFTENPAPEYAQELMSLGALWNLSILVGTVSSLLDLYAEDHAAAVLRMRDALKRQAAGDRQSLERLYDTIAPFDFAHDVLEVQATRLQVLRVPHCGWTDLGTVQRVDATLRQMMAVGQTDSDATLHAPLFFDLGAERRGTEASAAN